MEQPSNLQLDDLKSYLLGAMHDGTVRERTFRISQREEEYVLLLKALILAQGRRAWTYREGKKRDLYVVEFSRAMLDGHRVRTRSAIIHYVRGYFDAEGSVASPVAVQPYVYFGQKDLRDLEELRRMLCALGVSCGTIPNTSRRADPDYWRFFVSR
ncbi:MAG TPA: LAGLIDADG family homing endonuclease [Thermoplasmata archaeon]|nr:LAGLIDADG family homing endonuclease [Thermoplasmata archaeon]